MGPSMSSPSSFQNRNRQRHMQAYLRRQKTEMSQDSKIKFKSYTNLTSFQPRQASQHKIMHKQTAQGQPLNIIKKPTKNQPQNQEDHTLMNKTPISKTENQQKININKLNDNHTEKRQQIYQTPKSKIQKSQESVFRNSASKQSSIKKIVLGDHMYEVDVEKMKNRRLQSKLRYGKSILSSNKNQTKLQNVNAKAFPSPNNISNNVSTLELQSQIQHFSQQNSNQPVSTNSGENVNQKDIQKKRSDNKFQIDINNQRQMVQRQYYGQNYNNARRMNFDQVQRKVTEMKSQSKVARISKYALTEKVIPKNGPVYEEYYQTQKIIRYKDPYQSHTSCQRQLEQSLTDSKSQKSVKFIKVQKK